MTGKEAATILDVARLAEVSRTTVSRALNEPELVSPETLARVRAAADRLSYVPSAAARSLRNGRTGTVALLVGDVSQPFHGGLARAIARDADDRGMSVMLHDLGHSETRLRRVLQRLPKQGVDAVILATADALIEPESAAAIRAVVDAGILVISTVDRSDVPGVISLGFDHATCAAAATAALAAAGRSHVALLGGGRGGALTGRLVAGFERALAERGLSPAAVLESDYEFEDARRVLGSALDAGLAVDALVAATVPMALGAIRAAEDRGIRVPEELSVISCEEVPLAAQVRPSISSISLATDVNGTAIMALTAAALAGAEAPASALTPEYRFRDSFRPAGTNDPA